MAQRSHRSAACLCKNSGVLLVRGGADEDIDCQMPHATAHGDSANMELYFNLSATKRQDNATGRRQRGLPSPARESGAQSASVRADKEFDCQEATCSGKLPLNGSANVEPRRSRSAAERRNNAMGRRHIDCSPSTGKRPAVASTHAPNAAAAAAEGAAARPGVAERC